MSRFSQFDGRDPGKARALRLAGRCSFVLALLTVTGVALVPGVLSPPRLLGMDKAEHLVAFAVLTLLMRLGWPQMRLWLVALVLAAHGGLIELLQGSAALERSASLADFAADLLGIGLGLLVTERLMRIPR